jgi:hypothetical protein
MWEKFLHEFSGRGMGVVLGMLLDSIGAGLVADLALFEKWTVCRDVHVEHGADGARVLTLMALARRYRAEQAKLTALRQAGQRTRHMETMYVLDLAIDRRVAAIPVKPTPWGRFEAVLEEMNLE